MRASPATGAEPTRSAPRAADAAVGTATPSDWTRFDVATFLRALRGDLRETRVREPRKLQLRWWHATKEETA
eukprot:7664740-Pyramimonas_sp.AAC.1